MHHTRVNLSVARLHSLDISLESFLLLQEISAHDPIGAALPFALLVPLIQRATPGMDVSKHVLGPTKYPFISEDVL